MQQCVQTIMSSSHSQSHKLSIEFLLNTTESYDITPPITPIRRFSTSDIVQKTTLEAQHEYVSVAPRQAVSYSPYMQPAHYQELLQRYKRGGRKLSDAPAEIERKSILTFLCP